MLNPVHDNMSSHMVTNNYSYNNNSSLGTLHTTYNHALSRGVYSQGQGAYIGGQPGQMWKTTRQATGLAQVNDRGLQVRLPFIMYNLILHICQLIYIQSKYVNYILI